MLEIPQRISAPGYVNSKSKGQSVPECVEGEVTHDAILNKFKDCYQDLYNSAGTEEAMQLIKEDLKKTIGSSSLKEVCKVTGEVVKLACCRMNPGKMNVTESFSSDLFLNTMLCFQL